MARRTVMAGPAPLRRGAGAVGLATAPDLAQLVSFQEEELWGRSSAGSLDRWDRDRATLRQTLVHAQAPAEVAQGVRLAAATWRLWWVRGYWAEGRELLGRLLSHAGAAGDLGCWAKVVAGAGTLAHAQGDCAAARALYQESLAAFRDVGDRNGAASVIAMLGHLARNQSDYATARRLYDDSLALATELGERRILASVLTGLGVMANEEGEGVQATAFLEAALALGQELGLPLHRAWTLSCLASLARRRGQPDRAQALYETSLALRTQARHRPGAAEALYGLGILAYDRQDFATAGPLLANALRMHWALRDKLSIAASLEAIAQLVAQRGQPERALRLAGAADALRAAIAAPLPTASRLELDRALEPARRQLQSLEQRAPWIQGQVMLLEQAVEEALAGWDGGAVPFVGQVRPLLTGWIDPGAGSEPNGDGPAVPLPLVDVARLAPAVQWLAPREREVLRLLATGASNASIAAYLGISVHTVRHHVTSILAKLGAESRGDAVARALGLTERGYVPPAGATLLESLSAREREVFHLLAAGASNRRIAAELNVSVHTVSHHVTSVLAKLGASTRGEAVARALAEMPS